MLTNKEIKKRASASVVESGVWLKLSLGVCICVASAMIPYLISSLPVEFAAMGEETPSALLSGISIAIWILLTVLLTLPVFGGFFGMSHSLYKKKRTYLADIFLPFTSPRAYGRSLLLGVFVFLRAFVLLIGPIMLLIIIANSISMEADIGIIFLTVLFGILIIDFLGMFSQRMYFIPFFLCEGYKPRAAISSGRALIRRNLGKTEGYCLGFTGLWLLSFLTVGMLFAVYTLPLTSMSYFVYTEQMILNKQNKEREILK